MLTFPTLIKGTITGLRISAVDGTAFIDNAGATIPTYADGNHSIEIYDSSNRMLKGVLKAAGTSETLGDEKIDTWVNNGYDTLTLDGSDIDAAIEAGTNNVLCYKYVSPTTGAMYKFVLGTLTITSGKTPTLGLCCESSVSPARADVIIIPAATGTYYVTSSLGGVNRYVGFRNSSGEANWSASGITFKQVLTPSSSGATIVSAKGGAIYNFASKDASFTYNAASYRYAIYDTLKVSRPTRYMGVSTHNI
jgi:hypothetical protein